MPRISNFNSRLPEFLIGAFILSILTVVTLSACVPGRAEEAQRSANPHVGWRDLGNRYWVAEDSVAGVNCYGNYSTWDIACVKVR